MALKLPLSAPHGFESAEGYRRLTKIEWNPEARQILFFFGDFKDEETRHADPGSSWGGVQFGIGPLAKPAGETVARQRGRPVILPVQAVPAYDEYMNGPIGDDLPELTPQTTRRDVLAAIGYAFGKTRDENQGAKDV